MPKSGTAPIARHMSRPGSMAMGWHGCCGATFTHVLNEATPPTMLVYSMPRSRTGLMSSGDAAGDTHATTRLAKGIVPTTAAVLHIPAVSCFCAARTWTWVIAVASMHRSSIRQRSRWSRISRPFTTLTGEDGAGRVLFADMLGRWVPTNSSSAPWTLQNAWSKILEQLLVRW
eukprot:scaffold56402_cov64-Phaeocystis_antarctica.AAC.1